MIKGDTVYVVNVSTLRVETGTLDGQLEHGHYHVKLSGDRWASRIEAWRVFGTAFEAREFLAEKMRDRAATLRREADDLEARAFFLVLTQSVPHTPA